MSPEVPMIARLRRTLAAKDEQITALHEDIDGYQRRIEELEGQNAVLTALAEARVVELEPTRRRYDLQEPDPGEHEPRPGGLRDPFGTNPGA